jgi:hypothetical protein
LDHLLEDERALQEALYIRGTEHLFFDSFLHRSAENFLTVTLQNVVQPIDVVEPLPGPTVNDLREVEESRLSEFQQLLALQITLAALARYRVAGAKRKARFRSFLSSRLARNGQRPAVFSISRTSHHKTREMVWDMPTWMLTGPKCSHKFPHSKIGADLIEQSLRDPFRIVPRPVFSEKG